MARNPGTGPLVYVSIAPSNVTGASLLKVYGLKSQVTGDSIRVFSGLSEQSIISKPPGSFLGKSEIGDVVRCMTKNPVPDFEYLLVCLEETGYTCEKL